MAINFKEKLENILVKNIGEMSDVITRITWRLYATKDGITKDSSQVILLDTPDQKTFTEYSSLSEEQVYEWVESIIGADEIQARKNGLMGIFDDGYFNEETAKSVPWENA